MISNEDMGASIDSRKMNNKLVFVTLSLDLDNVILAHSETWAIAFGRHFRNVDIYALRIGEVSEQILGEKFECREFGGGTFFRRLVAFIKIMAAVSRIIREHKNIDFVFYHMCPVLAALMAPLIRLTRIRQALWYSHSNISASLNFASKVVNEIYTPIESSFPLELGTKVKVVGHGIDTSQFEKIDFKSERKDIAYLGRISRIKRLETIISAISEITSNRPRLHLIGPVFDIEYKNEIIRHARIMEVVVCFQSEIGKRDVPSILSQYSMFYSGNPRTLDKSAVEAALSGTVILSEDSSILKAFSLDIYWKSQFIEGIPKLEQQIQSIMKMNVQELEALRSSMASTARQRHSLENLSYYICQNLQNQIS
jgi:glycosyltransferase involved in cell wall biosynthesis